MRDTTAANGTTPTATDAWGAAAGIFTALPLACVVAWRHPFIRTTSMALIRMGTEKKKTGDDTTHEVTTHS